MKIGCFPSHHHPPLPLLPPKNGNALFFIFQCGYFYFEHKNKEEMIFFCSPPRSAVVFGVLFFPLHFRLPLSLVLLSISLLPRFSVSLLVGWLVGCFSSFLFWFFVSLRVRRTLLSLLLLLLLLSLLIGCGAGQSYHTHTHTRTHTHRFVGFTHTKKKTSNEERKGQNWEETKGTRVGVGWTGRGGAMWVCIQFSISFISLFSPCLMAAATRRRIDSGTRLRVCASECVCIDY